MTQRNESKSDSLTNGTTDKVSLENLRKLLLAPEQQALADLHEKVNAAQLTSDELSAMLPESIAKARDDGSGLSRSLGPVMDEAIKESIKNDPETLAEAISPIMMPAIRRAVIQMIAGMADSFNRTLEQSLSSQGIKWRIEAFRTGRSFSEVAMLHSLVYRVEQVFLIHRETGLLLAHVANKEGDIIDADMISGMLTAIQDFVRESFSDGRRQLLNTMDCEEHDVLIEYGSQAILAAVVSGIASAELRHKLAVTLDNIQAKHAPILEDFSGDSEPFAATHPQLEQCLLTQQHTRNEGEQQRGLIARFGWVIPVMILVGLLSWGALRYRAGRRVESFANATSMPLTVSAAYDAGIVRLRGSAHQDWLQSLHERTDRLGWLDGVDSDEVSNLDGPWIAFLEQLDQQPGLAVTESRRVGDQYHLTGLRDPLAEDPTKLLSTYGVDASTVHMSWSPYQSLERPIVQQRVHRLLNPPDTVSLNWQGDRLIVVGTSPDSWWRAAEQRVLSILTHDKIDAAGLQLSNPRLDAYLQRLENEPGIVVTSTEWHDGRLHIYAKRDDFAVDPSELMRKSGMALHEAVENWTIFKSDDPVIVERRVRSELTLPDSVAVSVRNGIPHLIGTASLESIQDLQRQVDTASSLDTIDLTAIVPDGIEALYPIQEAIEDTIIYFKANSVQITGPELRKVQQLKRDIEKLTKVAKTYKRSISVQVIGRTATETPQKALSIERCQEVVKELLLNSGLSEILFTTEWRDSEFSGPAFQDMQRGRVIFHVVDESG